MSIQKQETRDMKIHPRKEEVGLGLACVRVVDALLYPLAAPARTSARVSTGLPL